MPSVSTVCDPSCSWLDQQRSTEEHRLSPRGDPRVPETSQRCRRVRFTDEQRRRLGVKAKALGPKTFEQFAGIVTPDTLLELVQETCGQQIRRLCQARPRAPQDARQHRKHHRPHGKREPILMIYSDQGCPAQSRDHRGRPSLRHTGTPWPLWTSSTSTSSHLQVSFATTFCS